MSRDTPAALAEFTSRLHTERDALRAFVTLLETEQQALLNGQIEQLLTLAGDKTQAVHELNKLADARNVGDRGQKTEDGGQMWRDIQQLSAHARELNHTNGELIQSKLRHNQQALTVLHSAARSASGLYGPDGQPSLPTSGRTLGSG